MAKDRDRFFRRALAQVRPFRPKEWVGCLQPAAVLALLAAGAQVSKWDEWRIADFKKRKKAGCCSPSWFYFTVRKNSDLEERLLGAHPGVRHDKRVPAS